MRPTARLMAATAIRENPVDVFERLAIAEYYDFDRVSPNELHLNVPGVWCEYSLSLSWDAKAELLTLFLILDGRIPGGRSNDICRLLSLINERLAAGHVDFWKHNSGLVYRNCMALHGGATPRIEQAMGMMALAIDAAERAYPATQYVLWAGKSPEEALSTALVDLATQN